MAEPLDLTRPHNEASSFYNAQQIDAALFAKPVTVTAAAVILNRRDHGNRVVVLDRAAGIAVTLPPASGSGTRFSLYVATDISTNTTTVSVANAADTMKGFVSAATTTAGAGLHEAAGGTDDRITMDGSVKGGDAGSAIDLVDVAKNVWLVGGRLVGSGTLESSLSAAVS